MNERSVHPYEPFIPQGADRLIIGTIPPYRFCRRDGVLLDGDVDFYYGSRSNYFWHLMSDVSGVPLEYADSDAAVEERKRLLRRLHTGITDIVESCTHRDGRSDDASLCDIERRNIAGLLSRYPSIDELIYTSRFVISQMNAELSARHRWLTADRMNGEIVVNRRCYRVRVLYSPSPLALRSVSADKRLARYREIFAE